MLGNLPRDSSGTALASSHSQLYMRTYRGRLAASPGTCAPGATMRGASTLASACVTSSTTTAFGAEAAMEARQRESSGKTRVPGAVMRITFRLAEDGAAGG